MNKRKAIAILGAGFGGLHAAKKIAKGLKRSGLNLKYEVILIDKNDHHTYTPLLYEVATTSKETANFCKLHELAGYNITSLIKGLSIRFIQKEVVKIEPRVGIIKFSDETEIGVDYMVLALGCETNYFDIPGLRENSIGLKTLWDAIKIRETLTNLAQFQNQIKIVIGGGGPTGVEIAGELKSWFGEFNSENSKCELLVSLVEPSSNVLSGLDKRIAIRARKRLSKLGVRVFDNDKISSVLPNEATLKSGRVLDFDILIWTGGVKASSLVANMKMEKDERGRIRVHSNMACKTEGDLGIAKRIYAIGDNVCFLNPKTNKPIPGVARAAISQGGIAAHNVLKDIKAERGAKEACHKRYRPMDYPYVVPVGGKYAIAKIGPFIIPGFPGWILKGLVELNYLLSIMPTLKAFKTWFKGLWVFMQNDRLG